MNCDYEMLARVLCHHAELSALETDVKGMVAENVNRERRGEAMAYVEKDFVAKAAEMRNVANALHELGWR